MCLDSWGPKDSLKGRRFVECWFWGLGPKRRALLTGSEGWICRLKVEILAP